MKVAAGLRKGVMKRVVVSFDDETFEAVATRAVAGEMSFAASVRELVEWGLLSEADDPEEAA